MAGDFTDLVERLMRERGISGRELAKRVPYDSGGMTRIISGERRCPPDIARKIDEILDAHETIIKAAAAAPQPPAGAEKVRRSLEDALADGAMPASMLDDWETSVTRYGYRTRDTASPALLADITADLADLRLAISRHRSASALPRLASLAARMCGLMCLTLIKGGDRQAWRRWGRTARHAAGEADDTGLLSWAIAQESYGWFYAGDMREAVAAARAAQAVTAGTGVGAALAAALEMRAHVATGDRDDARAAHDRAENALSGLVGRELDVSAFGYTEAHLRFHSGSAWTILRDTAAALEATQRALDLCTPADFTDWALTRLDRAACMAIDGDAEAALGYAAETLQSLDSPRRVGIISDRGRKLLAAIPPQACSLPAARDFRRLLETKEITA
jgi:tetratricopeptide (TPR) repeat protein